MPPPINPAKVPIAIALPTFSPVIFSPVNALLVTYERPPAAAPPTADAPICIPTLPAVLTTPAARIPPPAAIGAVMHLQQLLQLFESTLVCGQSFRCRSWPIR
jgi:hypothetical protein